MVITKTINQEHVPWSKLIATACMLKTKKETIFEKKKKEKKIHVSKGTVSQRI